MKEKRGVSVIIGYLLLVTFAIMIGVVTYGWLKTYLPSEARECPEGTAISIREANCVNYTGNFTLGVTMKNNGRFKLAGCHIYISNSSEQEVETIDLSDDLVTGGFRFGSSILFGIGNTNGLGINEEVRSVFQLDDCSAYSVRIIPTRFEEIGGKTKYLTCGDAAVREEVSIL